MFETERKGEYTDVLIVRVTPAMSSSLRLLAARTRLTVSDIVRRCIVYALKHEDELRKELIEPEIEMLERQLKIQRMKSIAKSLEEEEKLVKLMHAKINAARELLLKYGKQNVKDEIEDLKKQYELLPTEVKNKLNPSFQDLLRL